MFKTIKTPALLLAMLAALFTAGCNSSGGGAQARTLENVICLPDALNDANELTSVVAGLLDTLSPAQLTGLLSSLTDQLNLPLSGLGDLTGLVTDNLLGLSTAVCALQEGLNDVGAAGGGAGGLDSLLGGLGPIQSVVDTLLGLLDPSALTGLLDGIAGLLPAPVGDLLSVGDLLNLLGDGTINPDDLAGLTVDGLLGSLAGNGGADLGAVLAPLEALVPGLTGVLDTLSGSLPGGLDSLPLGDLTSLIDGLMASDSTDTLAPIQGILEDVLGSLVGTLIPDPTGNGNVLTDLLDSVLGVLGGLFGGLGQT